MNDPSHVRRVTMEDLARSLGLAKSTISLALRGSPKVRPATRDRVQQTAAQMGYLQDAVLSAYARRRRQGEPVYHATMGVIWPEQRYAYLQPETEAQIESIGYRFDQFYLTDYTSTQHLAHTLHARGIPALLVMEHPNQTGMTGFPWHEFLAVQCGVSRTELPIPAVRYNAFETIRMALARLERAGCRKVGAVLPHHGEAPSTQHDKVTAAYEFLTSRSSLATVPALIGSIDQVRATFPAWHRRGQPDAVIGPWPRLYQEFEAYLSPGERRIGYLALKATPGMRASPVFSFTKSSWSKLRSPFWTLNSGEPR